VLWAAPSGLSVYADWALPTFQRHTVLTDPLLTPTSLSRLPVCRARLATVISKIAEEEPVKYFCQKWHFFKKQTNN
jgi:hypothetical protein